MKNNDKRQLDNNFIEQKVAEAFGYSDEQLAEELDRLMEEAEKSQDKALEAPEGEFERIWSRVERGHEKSRNKGSRVKRLVKVMGVAAALGMMLFGGSMWVGAKRHYVYEEQERKDLDNVIVLNDSSDELITDDFMNEKIAYERIKDELNIVVLELSYIPDNINFHTIILERNKGKLIFLDETNTALYFYQGIDDKPSSISYASDMKKYNSVYNKFLDEEIIIYENELGNENRELSIRITKDHQYYILQGTIDSDEFVRIVEGIKIYKETD